MAELLQQLIQELEKAVAHNADVCDKILAGQIGESDAVYMPELSGAKTLNDREIYIYRRAFNDGVKAVLNRLKTAGGPEKDLMAELFEEQQ